MSTDEIPLPPEPPDDFGADDGDNEATAPATPARTAPPAAAAEFRTEDIAGVVQDLAHELEQMQALVRTLGWGVDHKTSSLRDDLDELTARVAGLEPPAEEKEPTPTPQAWVDYATAEDWAQLATWVDWLIRTYDVVQGQRVLPCWPAHSGVAEELAALRSAWHAAAISGRAKKPNDALIYWHDRWLHPALQRLHTVFQHKACLDSHKATRNGAGTDPDLLTAAQDAATPATTSPAVN